MTPGPASGIPARGYSWPPAEPGNVLAMKHGAHSARVVEPVAEQIAADLERIAPDLAGQRFAPAVSA